MPTGALSSVAPLHYVCLMIVTVLAYLIYQEVPSTIEVVGALVTCLGTWWAIANANRQTIILPR